ncbi:hypothetical protein K437DRAFT_100740 [Tilletiaria anomala UBC 951]|uniref:POP1-domain-containing protein n=1 Tax=Tilletiaria anomala (strain ATCC 24038 / CBS 436.72 / UBC 951) TaxID=1037660 RepID=A0A066VZI4_TILAU|nr:uncharacterized protein K437DRAFT_100740 [Tilletiaria anomala UBC 951]KDN47147.1 hypothetical protein K437DRAFT_100740 [Tilletiaria anomala UBC 951]
MVNKRKRGPLDGNASAANGSGQVARSPSRKIQRMQQRRDARVIAAEQPSTFAAPIPKYGAGQPRDASSRGPVQAANVQPSLAAEISYLGGMGRRNLPPQLSVEAALSSRAFQVRAMLNAMASARSSQTTRAWQLLPRHMRRRAASHNLLRLPARLRSKGARELQASKTLAKTRSQVRKRDVNRTVKLADLRKQRLRERSKRQGARWLETHMWHAKRFHMTRSPDDKVIKRYRLNYLPSSSLETGTLGMKKTRKSHPPTSVGKDLHLVPSQPQTGFIVAEKPHMKAHRASWRSAQEKIIIHDASYDSWFKIACTAVPLHPSRAGRGKGKGNAEDEEGTTVLDALAFSQTVLARVIKRGGVAAGWEDNSSARYWDGSTECSTVLLGKPGGRVIRSRYGGSKGKEMDSENDPVLQGKLDVADTGKGAGPSGFKDDDPVDILGDEALSAGEGSLLSHARLIAPLRLFWLPETESRDPHSSSTRREALIRCHPSAATVLHHALLQAAQEENELQKRKTRHRRSSLARYVNHDSQAMDMDAPGTGSSSAENQKATEGDFRLEVGVHRLRSAPSSDAVVPSGRRSNRRMLRKKLSLAAMARDALHRLTQPRERAPISKTQQDKLMAQLRLRSSSLWRNNRLTRAEKVRQRLKRFYCDYSAWQKEAGLLTTSTLTKDETQVARSLEGELHVKMAETLDAKSSVDLEGFNTFELVGPDSGRLLGGVLRPVNTTPPAKRKAFKMITHGLAPSQVPPGLVLSLDVHDPRLSFPPSLPRNDAVAAVTNCSKSKDDFGAPFKGKHKHAHNKKRGPGSNQTDIPELNVQDLAVGSFWRRKPAAPVFSKGDIDHRRSKQLIPGSRLEPTSMDDIVPVVIIQHTSNAATTHDHQLQRQSLHGFTLLVPCRWGSIFWHSLVHPGTRVAGQAQVRQQAVEGGRLAFPHDYLGTAAFDSYWKQEAQVRKREWKKRPKGKRIEFDKLGVHFPFGGKQMWTKCMRNAFQLAQHEAKLHPILSDIVINERTQPWLLHINAGASTQALTSLARALLEEPTISAEDLSARVRAVLSLPGSRITINDLSRLSTAMVPVRVTACRRGKFEEMSSIFVDKPERDVAWRNTLHAAASEGLSDHQDELLALEIGQMDQNRQVGAVTSGGVSLTQGRGYGVGSISLLAYAQILLRDATWTAPLHKRKGRNPVDTDSLAVVRGLGGPVLRTASIKTLSA